jgi:NADH:ubiquinone oxidoreductase subunit 2 (subunit N)
MKPTNQNTHPNVEARYRTMLTLWFALLMSIGIYFAVSVFLAPQISNASETPPTTLFTVVLTALGILLVLLSFVVKRKLLERSVERQEVALVQQALIVACAMCEVSALLGLVERFLFDSHEYYLLFLIAAIGTALHFPRREHLLAATYKTSWDGAAS